MTMEVEKTVILALSPEQYEKRIAFISDYILSQYRSGEWISTERKHLKRYQFDANYNLYYVKLKFNKAGF